MAQIEAWYMATWAARGAIFVDTKRFHFDTKHSSLLQALELHEKASNVTDQTAENRMDPNKPVTMSELKDLGVIHWHLPPVGEYPAKAVPWEPKQGIQEWPWFVHCCDFKEFGV